MKHFPPPSVLELLQDFSALMTEFPCSKLFQLKSNKVRLTRINCVGLTLFLVEITMAKFLLSNNPLHLWTAKSTVAFMKFILSQANSFFLLRTWASSYLISKKVGCFMQQHEAISVRWHRKNRWRIWMLHVDFWKMHFCCWCTYYYYF